VHAENYNQEFATILLESKRKIPQLETFLSIREKKIITVGGTKTIRGLEYNQVRMARLEVRNELIERFNREEFEGMRAYVTKQFPSDGNFNTVQGLVLSDRQAVFGDVYHFIGKLESEGGLSRDITINTKPTEAVFRIKPLGGGRERSTTSDSTMLGVYRGLYTYTIEKAGYKKISETLNLVDERVSKLICELHEDNALDGPHPCKRQ